MARFSVLDLLAGIISVLLIGAGLGSYSAVNAAPCTNWAGLIDTDCDSLADVWETSGYDVNYDGTIDLNFPAMGANPNHKDIFLEIDYMQYHAPRTGVLPAIVTAFANAPVQNPDGLQGINLHYYVDEQIPHQTSINVWTDFDALKDSWFGTYSERQNTPNAVLAKAKTFHYALFVHQYNNGASSGTSEIPGNDIVVSLGATGWGTYNGHTVGTVEEQKGTLMHELGHNLGLRHGGNVDENCKPNYLSVMNYAFQFPDYVSSRPLDYSRSQLNTISETGLDEGTGISPASSPTTLKTVYGPTSPLVSNALSGSTNPINWDRDSNPTPETGIVANVNNLGSGSGCTSASNTVLGGFNDWANLQYWGTTAGYVDGATVVHPHRDVHEDKTVDNKHFARDSLLESVTLKTNSLVGPSTPPSIKSTLATDFNMAKNALKNDNLPSAIQKLVEIKDLINSTSTIQPDLMNDLDNLIVSLMKQR